MKKIIAAPILLLTAIFIYRSISLGCIFWYEIAGIIGSICFIACSFMLGFYAGQGKLNYDRDIEQNWNNIMQGRLK